MAYPSPASNTADPYGHLLQRLALALHEADRIAQLSDQPSADLEVRGLTPAELALIQAYLAKDRAWLSGLDAAAPPPFEPRPSLCRQRDPR